MGAFSKYWCQQFLVLTNCFWSTMNSISLLCLLPLLTSVLALPAADLLDQVLDPNEEHLAHPHQEHLDLEHSEQEHLDHAHPHRHQAGDSHLNRETEKAAVSNNGGGVKERATDCALFLCIRDGSTTNSTYPWLINNKNARFAYTRTDGEGYSSYSYQRIYNGQTLTYYLHFYDEGLFYNGFWVVNDLETGYVETEGRVFIYNSENDYCPESTYNYWYFWKNGDWVYNTGIYLENC